MLLWLLAAVACRAVDMRRPLGPGRPMWLVHIDNLYGEDAARTIDAVPADLLPYVVFNISVSNTKGTAVLDRYLETCRSRGVWVMIQPSAGTRNCMSDSVLNAYEDYYRRYPNLIGYNFCEQSWGFDRNTTFITRLELFCKLLELGAKYGGYLYVNDMQSVSNNPLNTISKQKAYARYVACARRYAANFIYGDKLTMGLGYYDNESACLGMFLSGLAAHYAIRYDQYSWSFSGRACVFGPEYGSEPQNSLAWFSCPEAAGGISIVEHVMMTGATVIDGPEVPTVQCIKGGRMTPAGKNVVADIMRKIVDGTIRIPTRQEVASRVKVAYVCDSYNTVTDSLYAGLYQMDGHRENNRTWLKSTGRYLVIPTFAEKPDSLSPDICVSQSGPGSYRSRWPDTAAKTAELDTLYPAEYSGDMYAGRMGSGWLAYNPYVNTDRYTNARIPLRYNTCRAMSLSFAPHTFGVINEHADGLDVYLNNYRTDKDSLWNLYPGISAADGLPVMTQAMVQDYVENTFISHPADTVLRRSVICVEGCASEPRYTLTDRGSHAPSRCTAEYDGGTFTLTVMHNGPLDLSITCRGGGVALPEPDCRCAVEPTAPPVMDAAVERADLGYDFGEYPDGTPVSASTAPWLPSVGDGRARFVAAEGGMALSPEAVGGGTEAVGVAELSRFCTEADYSVTWREYTADGSAGGILMRATPYCACGNPGLSGGYYFRTSTDMAQGTTRLAIRRVTVKASGTAAFDDGAQGMAELPAPRPGEWRWYRATCRGNLLTFEYSDDGTFFTTALRRTDGTYPSAGYTKLLWETAAPDGTSGYGDIRLGYLSDGTATSVGSQSVLPLRPQGDDAWYTIQGVRVTRPAAPGIYIRGGRKIVVR